MSDVEMIEQGPTGSYGDAVAEGGFDAAPRTVPGWDHPDALRENADPREAGGETGGVALDDLSVDDLKEQAKSRGMEGYSGLRKAELIEAIQQHDSDSADGLAEMSDDELRAEADALGVDADGLERDELLDAIRDERDSAQG